MSEQTDTLSQIMDVAQQIMHVRGYNSFSYANISQEVGIKKASIHYYFPNKSDLVREVVARHRRWFRAELEKIIQQTADPRSRLELYARLYFDAMENGDQMCFCGMLAADFPTLPPDVRAEVEGFFADNEIWLTRVIGEGKAAGVLHVTESVEIEAQLLVSGIEGAMLVARTHGDVRRFRPIVQRLFGKLLA